MVEMTEFEPANSHNQGITLGRKFLGERAPVDTRYRASNLHPQPYERFLLDDCDFTRLPALTRLRQWHTNYRQHPRCEIN